MGNITRKLTGRQGDVGFVRCAIPASAKQIEPRPFALGEVTGHSHRVIDADLDGIEMFKVEDRTFLRVTQEGGISIQHEDHDPQAHTSRLPQGWEGEVIIAREYDEEGDFRVVD